MGTVLGPYEVVEFLSAGGMGAVYRVQHTITGKLRALKVVLPSLAADEQFRRRFVREVTLASSVRHPNLVETFDPLYQGGVLALPMELLEGETLFAYLKRVGRVPPDEVVRLLAPCCRAVHAVHRQSVIHRDLKPLNIFLAVVDGVVVPKVLDFGAARELVDDEHTREGQVIGSPYYMAPEQASGARDLDARADVYSMAVIAYLMLSGRRPYEGESSQAVYAKLVRREAIPNLAALVPNGTVPAALIAVVHAGLSEREQRTGSMEELATGMERALGAFAGAVVSQEATVLVPEDSASGIRATAGSESSAAEPAERRRAPTLFEVPPAGAPQTTPSQSPDKRVLFAVAAVLLVGLAIVVARSGSHQPTSVEPTPSGPMVAEPPASATSGSESPLGASSSVIEVASATPERHATAGSSPDAAVVRTSASEESVSPVPRATGPSRARGGASVARSDTTGGGAPEQAQRHETVSQPPVDELPCGGNTPRPCID